MTRNHLKNLFFAKIIVFLFFFAGAICIVSAQSSPAVVSKLQKCGEYDFADTTLISTAFDNNNIYVGTEDGSVHAIDPITSRKIWSSNIGGQIASNLVVSDGRIMVAANAVLPSGTKPDFSILRSLSTETGLTNWTFSLPYSSQLFLGSSGNAIISVGLEGAVTASEHATGNILWKTSFTGRLTAPPAFADDRFVFGTNKKEVLMISARNGETTFRSKIKFLSSAVSIHSEKKIAIGDERGNLVLLDINTGKTIWKFKSGAKIPFISPTVKGLLAASNDNFVYMISDYNGDIIWKRRLPGRVAGHPLIASEIVILPLNADKSTFLLDLENGKIVNQLTMNEPNSPGITPGLFKENYFVFSTPGSVISYSMNPCST